jgi:hypothetical protein
MTHDVPPQAVDRRQLTLFNSENPSHPDIVLDEWISDFDPQKPDHTAVLEECIHLARRIIFSRAGKEAATQILLGTWPSPRSKTPPSTTDLEALSVAAAAQVELLENTRSMTLRVLPDIHNCTVVQCDDRVRVGLRFDVGYRIDDKLTSSYHNKLPRPSLEQQLLMRRLMLKASGIGAYFTSLYSSHTLCSKQYNE